MVISSYSSLCLSLHTRVKWYVALVSSSVQALLHPPSPSRTPQTCWEPLTFALRSWDLTSSGLQPTLIVRTYKSQLIVHQAVTKEMTCTCAGKQSISLWSLLSLQEACDVCCGHVISRLTGAIQEQNGSLPGTRCHSGCALIRNTLHDDLLSTPPQLIHSLCQPVMPLTMPCLPSPLWCSTTVSSQASGRRRRWPQLSFLGCGFLLCGHFEISGQKNSAVLLRKGEWRHMQWT